MSSVNDAEVRQKAARVGVGAVVVDAVMEALGVTVTPFARLDARLAASFDRHRSGLSLADRVCLALARASRARRSRPTVSGAAGPDEFSANVTVIR